MTFRERVAKDYPYAINQVCMGGVSACPNSYGYESKDNRPCKEFRNIDCVDDSFCRNCWDRDILGTESIANTITEKEKENNMTTTKKTKAELMEELESVKASKEELEKELKDLEKYKQYEDMAGEVHAIYMAYVHAGFTEEQAYDLLKTMIQSSSQMNFNSTVKPSYRYAR